ncbi:MAG TPA: hypothetical protein VFI22_14630, partial [Thermomicrobiales bacterium]|nr:hypothetical protein [Thermomicrobiales bacterium]
MDADRFDLLARRLGAPGTRRGAIGVIFAAALGPAAAVAAPEPVKCLATGKRCSLPDAGRHGNRKRRKHGKHHRPSCNKCCSRFGSAGPDGKPRCTCKPEGEPCDGPSQCCGGLCRNGQCTKCPGDLTACNGNCVDLQTAPDHCGDCATTCANGQRCQDGVCVCDGISCPNGCCDDQQTCRRGTSEQACGDGGAACQTCGACATCDGSTCAPTDGACCDDGLGVCRGATCIDCDQGQRCLNGQCICDATSCPDGCCDGAICRGGDSNGACGTEGQVCQTCGTCLTCNGETCVNAVGVCCGTAAACRSGQCA